MAFENYLFWYDAAGMAKLADAPDLGSGAARRGGSSPLSRTTSFIQSYL